MELRHLRYFIAVAEELHFARAAERLHMEQSPLSRAIKELESDLDVKLFERTTRSTRITWAGKVFLDEARHILSAVEAARTCAKAAARGCVDQLRVGLSHGIAQLRLANLFAQCREDEPSLGVRIFELQLAQQVKGLRDGLLDVGFTMSPQAGENMVSEAIWTDPLAIIVPASHPLAAKRRITLAEAVREPLVLCHPEVDAGCHDQTEAFVRSVNGNPVIADHAASLGVMMTLVGAGHGIGFAVESEVQTIQRSDVAIRPFAGPAPAFTTYILRSAGELSGSLVSFLDRARSIS